MAIDIPVPKILPDVGEGGPIASVYNALTKNALANRKQELENQYYGPKAESEIGYRNALTKGQDIENQYSPQKYSLANEHASQVNKYYDDLMKNKIAIDKFTREHPLLKLPGAAGQIGAEMFLKELQKNRENNQPVNNIPPNMPTSSSNGANLPIGSNQSLPANANVPPTINQNSSIPTSQNPYDQYIQQIDNTLKSSYRLKSSQSDLNELRAKNYNWSLIPAETKNGIIAQGLGMGIDPVKMKDYVTSGLNIKQIAEKEDLDPDNIPVPLYFPTTSTKTRTQQVEQVGRELDFLNSATIPIIKRYADTFAGISGARLKDMFSKDPEAQKRFGEYIGALSLQTGIAAGRVLQEGNRPGLEIMRMVKNSALQGIDENSPIKMSGIAYEAAQNKINSVLSRGAKIRIMTGMSPLIQNQPQQQNEPQESEGNNTVKSSDNTKVNKRSKWIPGKGLMKVS